MKLSTRFRVRGVVTASEWRKLWTTPTVRSRRPSLSRSAASSSPSRLPSSSAEPPSGHETVLEAELPSGGGVDWRKKDAILQYFRYGMS